jgi:hypothetical protein
VTFASIVTLRFVAGANAGRPRQAPSSSRRPAHVGNIVPTDPVPVPLTEGTEPFMPPTRRLLPLIAGLSLLTAGGAWAHVKWFAPYIVDARPRPISMVLGDPWFWVGIVLVSAFFTAARLIERSRYGSIGLAILDRGTAALWHHLDLFTRAVIGGFFVAIFSIGGIYLTPDLLAPAPWVSWMQLVIAVLVLSRWTMPLAGLGIIGLWLLALQDHDPFHLLDYLALGLAVASYLIIAGFPKHWVYERRFELLRWGVAIALMWSSLEKFAYPEWFFPLVEERPYLTLGIPRDIFIPMAGVAEFTMGLGLLWTPLVRRLSALALLTIFTAAVIPFGRIDLIGHGLIMLVILVIAADRNRGLRVAPELRRAMTAVPIGIAGAFAAFITAYWGLHTTFYGRDGLTMAELLDSTSPPSTHGAYTEYPHGPQAGDAPDGGFISSAQMEAMAPEGTVADAYTEAMAAMHHEMMEGLTDPDPDRAFVRGMIPHHQGAVDMARVLLEVAETEDRELRALALQIVRMQEVEIAQMRRWLENRPPDPVAAAATSEVNGLSAIEETAGGGVPDPGPMDHDMMNHDMDALAVPVPEDAD